MSQSYQVISLRELYDHVVDKEPNLFQSQPYAQVVRSVGLLVEAQGIKVGLGSICWLVADRPVPLEVVGFDGDRCFLMPLVGAHGIRPGTLIRVPTRTSDVSELPATDEMLGRVVDGMCHPIDGLGDFSAVHPVIANKPINPLMRHPIDQEIDLGVRAINALLTVGRGQRVGLFAGSGVGKSVLLGMLARFVQADVVVVGLIGERGREVQEFIRENLGEGLARSVVVACPADDSAALRLRGARLATTIAESFREEGRNVLLLMDSLTRVAQAQREIGLAMGEPPSTRGYTPSSFAALPKLVERAGTGASANAGSITAFYTVLMEEDDFQDPVVDAARAILDGHVVLARELAEQGIYPAIDVGGSISRLMTKLISEEQRVDAVRFRQLWQCYQEQRDLIAIGAYQQGSDPLTDEAIRLYPAMCEFLRQSEHAPIPSGESRYDLEKVFKVAEPSPGELSVDGINPGINVSQQTDQLVRQ